MMPTRFISGLHPFNSISRLGSVSMKKLAFDYLRSKGMPIETIDNLHLIVWDNAFGDSGFVDYLTKKDRKRIIARVEEKYAIGPERLEAPEHAALYTPSELEQLAEELQDTRVMCITGRPSTGKSWLAKKLGEIYNNLGQEPYLFDDGDLEYSESRTGESKVSFTERSAFMEKTDVREGLSWILEREGSRAIIASYYFPHHEMIGKRVHIDAPEIKMFWYSFKSCFKKATPGLFNPDFDKVMFYDCDIQKAFADVVVRN